MLADLHGNGNPMNDMVQFEFEQIKEQLYFERTEGAKSYFDLFKPGVLHRVSLGASLQMWSQLSGVNLMMYVHVHVPFSSVLIRFQVLYYLRIPGGWPHPSSRQPHCRFCAVCAQRRIHRPRNSIYRHVGAAADAPCRHTVNGVLPFPCWYTSRPLRFLDST